ncbi:unnamed protein product [Fraxinus pennsylvanica]|uniref:DUF6737 domain-containing protein n=1 Tax=Fraxinus pennsylvanica TaxID=56036 RepID=A0AAD2A050_9LAMI|nr:unnamed protein product [Fraxinus pennsylvanica]
MIFLQTLSPFPIPLILTRQNPTLHSISLTQFSIRPEFCPNIPSNYENFSSRTGTALGSNLRDNDPVQESAFFDENGAVEDMDGYLNYLSLEYDSVWDTKPSWCQPWTITLTGMLIITSSWLILHSVLVTSVVLALICSWWYIFLYSYPKAYTEMIAERRKNVTSGLEDTYGMRKQ